MKTSDLQIYASKSNSVLELNSVNSISAGFPSPAEDFADLNIDLNKYLIKHPAATFFGRVSGHSMKDIGVNEGDLLIIDKSLEPANNKLAVCFIDGEFTLKLLKLENKELWLMPANENYKAIKCSDCNDVRVWGIVTYVVKSF